MTDENKLKTTGGGTEKTSGQKPLTRKQKRDLSKKRAAERAARGESAPQKRKPVKKELTENQRERKRNYDRRRRRRKAEAARIEKEESKAAARAERKKRLAEAKFKKVETRAQTISRLERLVKEGKATPGQKGYLRALKNRSTPDKLNMDKEKERLLKNLDDADGVLDFNKSVNGFWEGYRRAPYDKAKDEIDELKEFIGSANGFRDIRDCDNRIDTLMQEINKMSMKAQNEARRKSGYDSTGVYDPTDATSKTYRRNYQSLPNITVNSGGFELRGPDTALGIAEMIVSVILLITAYVWLDGWSLVKEGLNFFFYTSREVEGWSQFFLNLKVFIWLPFWFLTLSFLSFLIFYEKVWPFLTKKILRLNMNGIPFVSVFIDLFLTFYVWAHTARYFF